MQQRINLEFLVPKAAVVAAAFLGFSAIVQGQALPKGAPPVIRHAIPPAFSVRDTVSLLFFGDMMMHERQLSYDSRGFLEELEPLIGSADYAVANAEFTLAGPPYKGYPRFSAPDSYAANLREAGFDLLLKANNHILDRGSDGLRRTLLKTGGDYCGAGLDSLSYARHNPLIIRIKGLKIAFVNFTYGTNLGASTGWPAVSRMNKKEIARQLKECGDADFVVVLPHWGEEYTLSHNSLQREWAEFLVRNGADAVIGAHPHTVQDREVIDGVPVFYSLGNTVSNMSAKNTRLGLAVMLRLVVSTPDGALRLLEPELHFLWCCLPGKLADNYRVVEISERAGVRNAWKEPSDYDNMMLTYKRILKETEINQ